ncbi:type I phosphoribosyltransferase [[Mycoplasma] testudinis]|uniref:hypothetical protein n=1 Tax=[Mycoplasma] testudinis TaxID=33924 RepID=UPI000A990156|nr:hypothetical protein [[Mycoplasma] testudinis]
MIKANKPTTGKMQKQKVEKIYDLRLEKILLTEEQVNEGCERAAAWINHHYENKTFVMVGILKGCIPFFGSFNNQSEIRCTFRFYDYFFFSRPN